ncbi:MAG: beta-lactamase family protein [Verrucomicrobia bacterium]|nr:beta-lactamase family protein [Verrucomicrobiota bacterium]
MGATIISAAPIVCAQSPPAGPQGPPPELPEAKAIAQPKDEGELAAAITKLASGLAAAGKFSGSILLAAGDKVLVDQAWGDADRKAKVANTPDTAFDVGSIGKLFTQIAILQLAQAGKLELDEPFGNYVTNYPNKEIAGKVTIRQLMFNTGGIPDAFAQMSPGTDLKAKRELKDFLPLFASKPLEFEPGASNRYSSSGYIILGLVIEALSGKDYFSYIKDAILQPAGMTHSGFFDRGNLPAIVARNYDGDDDVTEMHPPRGSSAGGLQASAGDLFRLIQAIDKGKLLHKESIKTLRQLIPSPPGSPGPADESKLAAYGISGGAPGVSAQLAVDPQGYFTRVVLCNSSPPMAMAMGVTIRSWMRQLPKQEHGG